MIFFIFLSFFSIFSSSFLIDSFLYYLYLLFFHALTESDITDNKIRYVKRYQYDNHKQEHIESGVPVKIPRTVIEGKEKNKGIESKN